jgi:hypothetical protein
MGATGVVVSTNLPLRVAINVARDHARDELRAK